MYNFVYCGDGCVMLDEGDDECQVEVVVWVLGQGFGMVVNCYIVDVDVDWCDCFCERFVEGVLNVLVAICCFDEGVDIPEICCVYIFVSFINFWQFVQR